MGRQRSNFKCPSCGRQGSFRPAKPISNKRYPNLKYDYPCVEHYDSITKKKSTCYLKKTLRKIEVENYLAGKISKSDFWLKQSIEILKILEKKFDRFQKFIEQKVTDEAERHRIISSLNEQKNEMIALELAPCVNFAFSDTRSLTHDQQKLLVWSKKVLNYKIYFIKQLSSVIKLAEQHKRTGRFPLSRRESARFLEQNKLAYQWICNEPLNRELAEWARNYYKPVVEKKRKKLRETFSDSAFGSTKYPSDFSGIAKDE